MNVSITIDSTDRTSSVLVDSLRITDRINQQVNEASFTTVEYRPNIGDELTITDGSDTLFAGVIVRIKQHIRGIKIEYEITCKDFTHYLDKMLVNERYENTTVEAIIEDIIDNYTTGFTYNNVSNSQEVDTIAFNRIPASEAIERLAEITGYSWYVDYDKDIHFVAKNTEEAPFNLTTSGDNHVWDSLRVTEDLSQLRNRIYVIGGEVEGNERTETYEADGDQLQFPLANKFAQKPTVTVDSSSQTVGIDFLDDEASFDCFWSFQEKYIRFKTGTKPADTSIVEVTGVPLFPLVVNVGDPVSINEFGTYEFKIKDRTIKSQDQAINRARVELAAYAQALEEGKFITYRSGLRSGQTINIDAAGISGDFVIQSVSLTMRTPTDGQWSVSIASRKTLGVIEFLQSLIRDTEITQDEAETLVTLLSLEENATGTDTLGTPTKTSPPYVWGPDGGNEIVWNFFTWS